MRTQGYECLRCAPAFGLRRSGGCRYVSLLLVVFWATASVLFAKHVPPAPVESIVHNGIRYVVPNDHGLRAYVQASDVLTGRKLWTKTIVRHFYFPFAGTECMQYEYISTMELSDGNLIVTTDQGRVFSVDLRTRTVRKATIAPKPPP